MSKSEHNRQDTPSTLHSTKTPKLHKNYCLFLPGTQYNRNIACKRHDNLYGIRGGGGAKDRKDADDMLYAHMKKHDDPMSHITYFGVRLCGWCFFNYHKGQAFWEGQLIKKIWPGYNAPANSQK